MKREECCLMRTSNTVDSASSSLAGGRLGGVNVIQQAVVEMRMKKILNNECMAKSSK